MDRGDTSSRSGGTPSGRSVVSTARQGSPRLETPGVRGVSGSPSRAVSPETAARGLQVPTGPSPRSLGGPRAPGGSPRAGAEGPVARPDRPRSPRGSPRSVARRSIDADPSESARLRGGDPDSAMSPDDFAALRDAPLSQSVTQAEKGRSFSRGAGGGYGTSPAFPVPAADSRPPEREELDERDVMEFLEGLLEGFRGSCGIAPAGPAGKWSDLEQLAPAGGPRNLAHGPLQHESPPRLGGTALKRGPGPADGSGDAFWGRDTAPRSPVQGMSTNPLVAEKERVRSSPSTDSTTVQMRRHALRDFLEERCETVANSFDVLAGIALRTSFGGPGDHLDRIQHMFTEDELRLCLGELGYGTGATQPWWRATFDALDVDGDGMISLQDMYDALVLYLPPVQEEPADVFFSRAEEPVRRKASLYVEPLRQ